MAVFQIKLGLRTLTDNDLASYSQARVDDVSSIASFPGPGAFPELDDTIVKKDFYIAKLSAADDGSKADTAAKNDARLVLEDSLTVLAYKCRELANYDPLTFLLTGFGIKEQGAPIGLPPAPSGLEALEGPFSGSINLEWDSMPEADSFVVQMSTEITNPNKWKIVDDFPTKSKTTIVDLESGQQYWFRVAAINAAGRSGYSDPATKYAP